MDGLAEHTENRYLECLEEPRRISLGLPGRQGDICGLLGGPLLGTVSSHRVYVEMNWNLLEFLHQDKNCGHSPPESIDFVGLDTKLTV